MNSYNFKVLFLYIFTFCSHSVFPLFPSIHFLWHSLRKFLNPDGDNRYSAQSSAFFPEKSLDLFKNLSIPFIKFLSYWVQRQ
ncbi:hypothetical protein FAEPRAA2165_01144 [Faecalibacterium duncaniae]|uniref:Uncharacterized protein n=1 Tax=Faecalibacterium duncaniae (strain DSM 17677 / JCM 31915 / A2-165) TaxID=411483 RepID=C7H4D1_FAED2|nr:hypothetical protein FAEPRAA2165_01144 [Faecalibacterium duncaniae]